MEEKLSSGRYGNVFVLSAGRSGSQTFANACKCIKNYTAGHESRIGGCAREKISYPKHHIESDNRLSWMLGMLSEKYPDAFYVHLIRGADKIAESYNKRWYIKNGVMAAYNQGLLMRSVRNNNKDACLDYVFCVNENIKCFLKNRPHITIDIDDPKEGFCSFWKQIEAVGNMDAAQKALLLVSNKTDNNRYFYRKVRYFISCKLSIFEEWLKQVLM